jgi:hypothetical protein
LAVNVPTKAVVDGAAVVALPVIRLVTIVARRDISPVTVKTLA